MRPISSVVTRWPGYGGDQVEVCVAKRDIAAGEMVEASAIETRLWVADLLPAEAVRQASEVVGSKASSVMLAGEVLSKRRFQAEGSQIDVPDGQVALSVPAKDVQAVGGAIGPGSLVDVYATGGSDTQALAEGCACLPQAWQMGNRLVRLRQRFRG